MKGVVAVLMLLCAAPAAAQPTRGADRLEEMRGRYRMGGEEEEAAAVKAARTHVASQATPQDTFWSARAAVLRSDKAAFLALLDPDYRARKYPKGQSEYVKYVEYYKYYYLAMFARPGEVREDGPDRMRMRVIFTMRRADGSARQDSPWFHLRKIGEAWFLAKL